MPFLLSRVRSWDLKREKIFYTYSCPKGLSASFPTLIRLRIRQTSKQEILHFYLQKGKIKPFRYLATSNFRLTGYTFYPCSQLFMSTRSQIKHCRLHKGLKYVTLLKTLQHCSIRYLFNISYLVLSCQGITNFLNESALFLRRKRSSITLACFWLL